jgi:pimeloyl-ACP methyl ester carboxylesterase
MPHFTTAGQRLEYEWIGPSASAAPTLVFLHEGLGCLAMWRDFPARVASATGCGAFVYSRAGYGDSTPLERARTPSYVHEEARLLPAVLRAMNIERSIFIGHSDGASIALLYASSGAGSGTLGLILEAPHVFVENITIEGIKRTGELYRSTELAHRLARYHGDQTNAVFWGWYDTWLSPAFRAWNIEACLPGVNCSVLILQGEDDEYGSKQQVEAIVSQVSGSVELMMLPSCGHTPHRDQKTRVEKAMVDFIRRVR